MRKILSLSFFFAVFASLCFAQSADVGIKVNFAGGDVTSVSAEKIVLLTKDGAIDVVLFEKTEYKRVPPDNPSLKAAIASNFAEIAIGDKILVTGMVSDDKKSIPAKAIYLITKSDISQKQAKEREEWRVRGVTGRVTALNQLTKEITVTTPGLMGSKTTILTPKSDASFLRYAPDSENFNEAAPSSFLEIAIGDSIRALGDKSADGANLKGEKIITGAFQTIGGTVTAVNLEKNEIVINDFQTKKDVTIVVKKTSLLKQFPAEMAQRMAMAQTMAAGGGGNVMRPPQGNQTTPQQNPQQNPNQMPGGGNRGGSFDEMLERFPNIAVGDLKVGEMIAISSSKAANMERVTAIKLVSGIEPFIKAQQQMMAAGGNRQSGGANSSFTIPGLDGGGLP